MNYFSKTIRVIGLALLLFAVVVGGRFVGDFFSSWDSETGVVHIDVHMRVLLAPVAFILGAILVVTSGKDGEKRLSRGCAIGAIFLVLFIAIVILSVLLDMGAL